MKRITYFAFAILFMACIGLQMTEPIAAAKTKLFDSGHAPSGDGIVYWKAYQYNTNYIVVKEKYYVKGKVVEKDTISIKRLSKTRIKTIQIVRGNSNYPDGSGKEYYYYHIKSYIKSKLTAKQYYYSEIRPKT